MSQGHGSCPIYLSPSSNKYILGTQNMTVEWICRFGNKVDYKLLKSILTFLLSKLYTLVSDLAFLKHYFAHLSVGIQTKLNP